MLWDSDKQTVEKSFSGEECILPKHSKYAASFLVGTGRTLRCGRWQHLCGTAVEMCTSEGIGVRDVAIFPGENRCVSIMLDEITVWNMGTESVCSKHDKYPFYYIAFRPYFAEVLLGQLGGRISFWNLECSEVWAPRPGALHADSVGRFATQLRWRSFG